MTSRESATAACALASELDHIFNTSFTHLISSNVNAQPKTKHGRVQHTVSLAAHHLVLLLGRDNALQLRLELLVGPLQELDLLGVFALLGLPHLLPAALDLIALGSQLRHLTNKHTETSLQECTACRTSCQRRSIWSHLARSSVT